MIQARQFLSKYHPSSQRIIKHASALELLLLFGLFTQCSAFPVFNGTQHHGLRAIFPLEEDERFLPLVTPTEATSTRDEIPLPKVCDEILCDDGACVSDFSLCNNGAEDNPNGNSEGWKIGSAMFHYIMAICGVILVVVLILICIFAFEDEEYLSKNRTPKYDVKYTPKKEIDGSKYNSIMEPRSCENSLCKMSKFAEYSKTESGSNLKATQQSDAQC